MNRSRCAVLSTSSVLCRATSIGLLLLCSPSAKAQYFGKNKVGYKTLHFKTIVSPRIQLYYYSSDSSARRFLIEAERWYNMHQRILKDTIQGRNPVIIYNNHADFQQTSLSPFNISPSTGGVTESARRRVFMPYTHSHRSTNHVLGHEMVHAFQYNLIQQHDSLSLANLGRVPLWIIEGMAEFMSIGRTDPNTAMWLRDAVLEEYFPSIASLNTPRYFPYRYGHAFWAFVSGLWGDKIVRELYMNIATHGLERALVLTLGYDIEELSRMWKEQTKKYYDRYLQNKQKVVGEYVFSDPEAMIISPTVSPDGKYLALYTQIDPISGLDLVLADASNKKFIRKIKSIKKSSHIDFVSLVESAPTWSPDSKKVAVITFSRGRNVLTFIDAKSGRITKNVTLSGVSSLAYPAWSPDGKHIAVSGMRDGQSDLYLLDVEDHSVEQLTNDIYSDIQPAWSEDSREIVFSTDRLNYQNQEHEGFFNIAVMDVRRRSIRSLPLFAGADNLNPQFISEGGIIFLSDRDGFRNLYKHDLRISKTYAMTDLATGISGITPYSQAVSFSSAHSTVYYSLYQKGTFNIARSALSNFKYLLVDQDVVDKSAGYLPPKVPVKKERVTSSLETFSKQVSISKDSIKKVPYKARFKLEGISSGGIGISSSTAFGTGVSGGLLMKFSDVLANNDLFVLASVNGEIQDIGVGVFYLYKKYRIDMGIELSHIPQLAAFTGAEDEVRDIDGRPTHIRKIYTDVRRTFVETATFFSYFPFSSSLRLQSNLGVVYQSYRIDRYSDSYLNNGRAFILFDRDLVGERLPAPPPIFQYFAGIALVGDNSVPGLVGPLDGYRYHVESTQVAGAFTYNNLIVDSRYYYWLRPIGLAFRAYHMGRYGKGGEDTRIFPLNVAFPGLVRGYDFLGVYNNIGSVLSTNNVENQFSTTDYLGSKVLVGNAEIRIPFTGPKKAALIPSGLLFSEFALFFDWGLALSSRTYTRQLFNINYRQQPIYSTGLSLRVNLFGFFVLEPFFAIPFRRVNASGEKGKGVFGLNFFPSW